MNLDAQDEVEEVQEEGHQLLNVTFAQGAALPENRAYLDGCSTVTAFRTDKYLKGIKTLNNGIKINHNAGAVRTNRMGSYAISRYGTSLKALQIYSQCMSLRSYTGSPTTAGWGIMWYTPPRER
jgi:hypothetical protein